MTVHEVVAAFLAGREEFTDRELTAALHSAGHVDLGRRVLVDRDLVEALVNEHAV